MTSRAELNQLTQAQRQLARMAQSQLRSLFASLDLSDPRAARDALLQVMPGIVSRYGQLAASIAAEWAGDVYGVRAVVADSFNEDQVAGSVRYAAGHLFTPDPASFLGPMLLDLDKLVKQPGRDTLTATAERNDMGWVRVPQGSETCAFCLMLASRGAENIIGGGDYTYSSEWAAGGEGHKYHGDCDCAVMLLRSGEEMPDGYEPEHMYDMYRAAVDSVGSTNPKQVLAAMRRLHPDALTDGVQVHIH